MVAPDDLDPATRRRLSRAARCFSADGRLQRWPSKRSDQELALWVIWSQMPGDGQLSELDVNAMLRTWHDFEDYVLLRRELCELDLLRRTPDGAIYRRVSHDLPQDAETLLHLIAAQTA
ncbi:DUF2087 domain-containing protein [Pelagibacterium luteolum]|uniref:DUF2087 domain-containing protein n=1 Tax=Pelagibacterium luteolum TaxID=440168 RepID=A0A1G7W496_9HYPH|nr:DUF2087 domain-containing protein [Pelagibacterium luteolum]SDG66589.1 hypothetical protein SAMN04487974_105195 [Pelagibacterium luteolum]